MVEKFVKNDIKTNVAEFTVENENCCGKAISKFSPESMDQSGLARELLKAGEFTTSWDNPELWIKLVLLATAIMVVLWVMPIILSPKRTNIEKTTAYECGFAPFFIKEGIIEIQFVVVALLFLIFDLEVVYLVPLALNVGTLGTHLFSVFIVYVHLAWLMLAFEGFTGALSWPTWLTFEYNIALKDSNDTI